MIKAGKNVIIILIFSSCCFFSYSTYGTVIPQSVETLQVIITESSNFIYIKDNHTVYYGNSMLNSQSFCLDIIYSGNSSISHVNTTIPWWNDTPNDSSEPYQLIFDIPPFSTQEGLMNINIWGNESKIANYSISIILDSTSLNLTLNISVIYINDSTTTTSTIIYPESTSTTVDPTTEESSTDPPSVLLFDVLSYDKDDLLFIALNPFIAGFIMLLIILSKYKPRKRYKPFEDISELLREMKEELD